MNDYQLSQDYRKLKEAGTELAEAALYLIREYDGTHRLALAVAKWAITIANEGGRGDNYGNSENS